MKNLEHREGYLNRHINPLPNDKSCGIEYIVNDSDGEHIYRGVWGPYLSDKYDENNRPSNGYLGSAVTFINVLSGKEIKIGHNVWEQNNSEFVYYKLL